MREGGYRQPPKWRSHGLAAVDSRAQEGGRLLGPGGASPGGRLSNCDIT